MTTSLFVEKRASIQVSPTINNRVEGVSESWPEQITTALFSEHPYLADYEPVIEEVRSDGELGYYLGYVVFGNEDSPLKVPIFIRDFEILPFATFTFDGAIYPLTEERVREIQTTQAASSAILPTSPDAEELMQDQRLDPPDHTNFMGNRYIASKLGSIRKEDVQEMLKAADANKVPMVLKILKKGLSLGKKTAKSEYKDNKQPKTASYGAYHDTFLLEPIGGHQYRIRSMSAPLRREVVKIATRKEISSLPPEFVKRANEMGYAVEGPEPSLEADVQAGAVDIDKSGVWLVKTLSGESIVGNVVTQVVDFTNITLPMKVFFNGERAATQDVIAGVWIEEMLDMVPDMEPSGECVFICKSPLEMEAQVTVPFVVTGEATTKYGPGWAVETYLGDRVTLVRCDVVKMTEIETNTFLVPSSYPLKCIGPPEGRVDLITTPEEFEAFEQMGSGESARLLGDGSDSYSLVGSGLDEQFMDGKTALFHLTAIGAPNPEKLLKKADVKGAVALYGHIPSDLSDVIEGKYNYLAKQAEEICATLDVDRGGLVRVAEALVKMGGVNAETIDSVLSLGFVNAENAREYLEAESDLEEAQQALAGLVVASQMGYSEIPMTDVIGAMRNLEKVLDGLRKLKVEIE